MIEHRHDGSFENTENLTELLEELANEELTNESFVIRLNNIKLENDERTLLIAAATFAKTTLGINSMKTLLDYGADVNGQDNEGWKPLHYAANHSSSCSSLETIRVLLECGADINSKDNTGYTPLHFAAQYSNSSSSLETVKLLLENGADINIKDDTGTTPLHLAAQDSNNTSSYDTVKLLLENGADINIMNNDRSTPLHLAVTYSNESGSLETVKLLLENGADKNIKDRNEWSPLHIAALYSKDSSSLETVKLLLDSGADINIKDDDGNSPLHLAASKSNISSSLETVKLLLDSGADINIKDNDGWTPLHYSVHYSNNDSSLETVKILLDGGADINIKTKDGRTPLHVSFFISNVKYEVVKLLLDYRADLNEQDNKGWLPLHFAVSDSVNTSDLSKVYFLLDDINVNVNATSYNGWSPLHMILQHTDKPGCQLTAKVLLERGADIKIKNINGDNALDVAFKHLGRNGDSTLIASETIKLLMNYATYDVLNNCYYTCKKYIHQNMIRLHLFTMVKGLSKDTIVLISKQFKIQSSIDKSSSLLKPQYYIKIDNLNDHRSVVNNKDMENIMSYELNIDVKNTDNQQILSKSSEKQKIWMANKMIYYSELDHRTDGKDERLPFVANLYKRALAQCKLNEFIENAPGILEPEIIKELQCKIQKTSFV
jgi:ankyrin repeat protein